MHAPHSFDGDSECWSADHRRRLKWTIQPINIINADTFTFCFGLCSPPLCTEIQCKCEAIIIIRRNSKRINVSARDTVLSRVACTRCRMVLHTCATTNALLLATKWDAIRFTYVCVLVWCVCSRALTGLSNCFCLRPNVCVLVVLICRLLLSFGKQKHYGNSNNCT